MVTLISEIRKNWTSLEGKKNTGENETSGQGLSKLDDVILRLEALSSAYTDIQDRLYELDKSWKNNLMIYGVPCCDGEEDNPIITEEKVIYDLSIGSAETKYIKLNTKTYFFLITFNFVIHFKKKTFFSPSVFLSPLSKCIKKSSNFHLNNNKKISI